MKKSICIAAAVLSAATSLFFKGQIRAYADESAQANYKAAYSCDALSGTAVYRKNETERLPIASMCKIMTLILSFEAVEKGELALDEQVTVSENASGMGGSQVFLDTGLSYSAEELLKSIAVCSANDSCVAIAERICGSESVFVDKMNAKAKELGANDTLFANCTGLPKDPQYSCAKDVATMFRALTKYDKYYEFCKVRVEDFAHPDGRTTQMTNTNKLVRNYNGCDGGKTGFTNEAGFCLAATAKRGDMRIISVVIGAPDSKTRFAAVSSLFDECFARYESRPILTAGTPIEEVLAVKGSKCKQITLIPSETLSIFCEKGKDISYSVEYDLPSCIKAPVQKGDEIGHAALYVDGVQCGQTALRSGEDAAAYTFWEAYREGARNWNVG